MSSRWGMVAGTSENLIMLGVDSFEGLFIAWVVIPCS